MCVLDCVDRTELSRTGLNVESHCGAGASGCRCTNTLCPIQEQSCCSTMATRNTVTTTGKVRCFQCSCCAASGLVRFASSTWTGTHRCSASAPLRAKVQVLLKAQLMCCWPGPMPGIHDGWQTPNALSLHLTCMASAAYRLILHAVFTRLAGAGCCVVAFDMHGHGRSEPRHDDSPSARALIHSKEHLIDDAALMLDTFMLPLAKRACDHGGARLPIFGVAHSLGSAVLTLVEKRRPGTFAVRRQRLMTFGALEPMNVLHRSGWSGCVVLWYSACSTPLLTKKHSAGTG